MSLRPGRTAHLVIPLDPHTFSVWNSAEQSWTTVPGSYRIMVGDSSRNLPLSVMAWR